MHCQGARDASTEGVARNRVTGEIYDWVQEDAQDLVQALGRQVLSGRVGEHRVHGAASTMGQLDATQEGEGGNGAAAPRGKGEEVEEFAFRGAHFREAYVQQVGRPRAVLYAGPR